MDNYQEFARVYDTIMDDTLYDAWHDFSRRHLPSETTNILELACGTGKLSVQFARDGYAVTGLDLSEEMLTIAYNRALDELDESTGIGFIEGDMRDQQRGHSHDGIRQPGDSLGKALVSHKQQHQGNTGDDFRVDHRDIGDVGDHKAALAAHGRNAQRGRRAQNRCNDRRDEGHLQ